MCLRFGTSRRGLTLNTSTVFFCRCMLQESLYPFLTTYFYPRIGDHPDITEALQPLLQSAQLKNDTLIHGDFNLGNILASKQKYTIIDWTNAQAGDRRCDFCWASFLIWIYNGEDIYRGFTHTYRSEIDISDEDIERFESVACLRWLLLNRIANVPKNGDTDSRINEFIKGGSLLPQSLLLPE